ncbi:MAG: hypothetical protein BGO39_16685 [Chloroflexi bacterium 54-19]|nr:MAG: hypothetical protein BGO39_16685 [Chloroflexi bacterium 54-19]
MVDRLFKTDFGSSLLISLSFFLFYPELPMTMFILILKSKFVNIINVGLAKKLELLTAWPVFQTEG